MPDSENPKPKEEQKKEPTAADRLEETVKFITSTKQLQAIEGVGVPAPAQERVDLSKMFEVLAQSQKSMMEMVLQLLKGNPENQFYQTLQSKLEKVEQKLEDRGKVDPNELVASNIKTFIEVSDMMKQHLGLDKNVQASISDIPSMLTLERMKIEHDEKMKQWDIDREDRKNQRELEQKRWEADYGLKLAEFNQGQKAKERATGAIEDLFGSVVDSIETERHAAVETARKGPEKEKQALAASEQMSGEHSTVRIPKQFRCEVCGNTIEVSRDQDIAVPIICPNCKTEYQLQEFFGKDGDEDQPA